MNGLWSIKKHQDVLDFCHTDILKTSAADCDTFNQEYKNWYQYLTNSRLKYIFILWFCSSRYPLPPVGSEQWDTWWGIISELRESAFPSASSHSLSRWSRNSFHSADNHRLFTLLLKVSANNFLECSSADWLWFCQSKQEMLFWLSLTTATSSCI